MLQNVSGDGGQPSSELFSTDPGLCGFSRRLSAGLRPLSDAGPHSVSSSHSGEEQLHRFRAKDC